MELGSGPALLALLILNLLPDESGQCPGCRAGASGIGNYKVYINILACPVSQRQGFE